MAWFRVLEHINDNPLQPAPRSTSHYPAPLNQRPRSQQWPASDLFTYAVITTCKAEPSCDWKTRNSIPRERSILAPKMSFVIGKDGSARKGAVKLTRQPAAFPHSPKAALRNSKSSSLKAEPCLARNTAEGGGRWERRLL